METAGLSRIGRKFLLLLLLADAAFAGADVGDVLLAHVLVAADFDTHDGSGRERLLGDTAFLSVGHADILSVKNICGAV